MCYPNFAFLEVQFKSEYALRRTKIPLKGVKLLFRGNSIFNVYKGF